MEEIRYLYLLATLLLIFGIKGLTGIRSARRGNRMAALGMLIAIVAVLIESETVSWPVAIAGIVIGSAVGLFLAARVPLTAMPELVAAFNGLGGGASTFVALAYITIEAPILMASGRVLGDLGVSKGITLPVAILIGTATFSGSFVAYLKLSGKKINHPLSGVIRHWANATLGILLVGASVWLSLYATSTVSLGSSFMASATTPGPSGRCTLLAPSLGSSPSTTPR